MNESLRAEALSRIAEFESPFEFDDELYLSEVQDYEDAAVALKIEDRRELLKSRKQDRRERKRYAELVFRLVCGWLIGVTTLVVLSGANRLGLGETLLITLVGSTTASVVAIFVVVAKYLFPPRD